MQNQLSTESKEKELTPEEVEKQSMTLVFDFSKDYDIQESKEVIKICRQATMVGTPFSIKNLCYIDNLAYAPRDILETINGIVDNCKPLRIYFLTNDTTEPVSDIGKQVYAKIFTPHTSESQLAQYGLADAQEKFQEAFKRKAEGLVKRGLA